MKSLTHTHYGAATAMSYTHFTIPDTVRLTEDDCQEALALLSRRPVNNLLLSGLIQDNGIVSPKNRGTFFGCRDRKGRLVGVALIGTHLLFEASTDEAIGAFARAARDCSDVRMIFAEDEKLRTFWKYYRPEISMPEPTWHQMVKSGLCVTDDIAPLSELRVAGPDDLDQVVAAHAEMVFAETGVDPILSDPTAFRMRCADRVEQGRVWVWMDAGELIFKTDTLIVTNDAIYVEGLWVNPKYRGRGYGTRGLASLCRKLLTGSNMICGFASAEQMLADSLYRKVGFTVVAEYGKIYL